MSTPVAPTTTRDPRRPWVPSAFTRLARTHALNAAGDAMFALAMAGTVFFSVGAVDEARSRVAMLLIFTIAPFAVAAPLVGPLLDRMRGGRRWMVILLASVRAVLCAALIGYRNTWLLFPIGLLVLVMSRGYSISKSAIVPTTVHSDRELVQANAKLTLLGGLSTAAAAVPAGLLLWIGTSGGVLVLGSIVYLACALTATQLPKARVAADPPEEAERIELRSIGILLAASSMAIIRGIVGFVAFLFAFYAKENDVPLLLGAAAVCAQVGFLTGSVVAPALRRRVVEEHIIMSALGAIVVVGITGALIVADAQSVVSLTVATGLVSYLVGFNSNVAKQCFDAIVQRDAPDANRGRSFARFETRFQLVWVTGALIPTAVPAVLMPMRVGMFAIAGAAAFALVSYVVGRKRAARGHDHRLIRVPRPSVPRPRLLGFAGADDDPTADGSGWEAGDPGVAARPRGAARSAGAAGGGAQAAGAGAPELLGLVEEVPTDEVEPVPPAGLLGDLDDPATAPSATDVADEPEEPDEPDEPAGADGPPPAPPRPVLFDGLAEVDADHGIVPGAVADADRARDGDGMTPPLPGMATDDVAAGRRRR